jgi:ATP-dependent DNA ligase
MLSHPIEDEDFAKLDPGAFGAEWKWDGIRERGRVQALGPLAPALDPGEERLVGGFQPVPDLLIEDEDFAKLDPGAFGAEWKWDGIRVQLAGGLDRAARRAGSATRRRGRPRR